MGIIKAGDPGFLTAVAGDRECVDQGLFAMAADGNRGIGAHPDEAPPGTRDGLAADLTAATARGRPQPVAWRIDEAPVGYPEAVAAMEARVAAIRDGKATELVWLLEHPPLYTAGTSARTAHLLDPGRFPVYRSGRGGQYTYHGPGQRVGYVMLDLQRRRPDLRRFVHDLEEWLIRALARFGVVGERREGRVGIWVAAGSGEKKIAAIGVRVRRWVTFHGVALNIAPDLAHFDGVVPCGLSGYGVTSLADLGRRVAMREVDTALREAWDEVFGTEPAGAAPAGQASGR